MRKPKFFLRPIKTNYRFEEGESIETKVRRIVRDKEPIEDSAPIIYTDRKDGVMPAYNIRTDRWEIAQNAMMKIHEANGKGRNKANASEIARSKKAGIENEDKSLSADGAVNSDRATG